MHVMTAYSTFGASRQPLGIRPN